MHSAIIVNADLKKVISIGSDNLDYRFFVIAAAVIDEQNNVFVCDSRGSFVRKYDWQGRFIKEIGKYGQGPGDFSNAISGLCLNSDLYLLDNGNNRIVEIDRELNIKKYIKLEKPAQNLIKYGDRFYMVSRKGGEPFLKLEFMTETEILLNISSIATQAILKKSSHQRLALRYLLFIPQ